MFSKVIQGLMTYGAFRAGLRLPYLKTHDGSKDALAGTKVVALVTSTVFAPSLFPIYMYNDMNRIHLYLDGLKPEDYGYKTNFNDVMDIILS